MPSGGDADWKRMVERELEKLDTRVGQTRDWMMMVLGAGALVGGAIGFFSKQILAFLHAG